MYGDTRATLADGWLGKLVDDARLHAVQCKRKPYDEADWASADLRCLFSVALWAMAGGRLTTNTSVVEMVDIVLR